METLASQLKETAVGTLSPIELLPPELVWKLIEYVPEAVSDIRKTSRTLCNRTSEFARLRLFKPFHIELLVKSKMNREVLYTTIFIPIGAAPLFGLRLKINQPSLAQRCKPYLRRCGFIGFRIKFKNLIDAVQQWDNLVEAVGGRVEKVEVNRLITNYTFNLVYGLLKKIKFKQFGIVLYYLSVASADRLLKNVNENKIEHLSLTVHTVAFADPELFFIQLSLYVRSLLIDQPLLKDLTHDNAYLFGRRYFDWAPTILQMFSNKLDKLFIKNHNYPNYMLLETRDDIMRRLPQINKKLWFTATFYDPEQEIRLVTRQPVSVKDPSRENEPFWTADYL